VAGDPDQVTVPVYPVPAVVVVTGVAPVTGAVTPAIAATEMTTAVTVKVNVCVVDPVPLVAVIV
jgi:hypothetical protein